MIRAEIVADSLSPQGDRLTSLLITFPRIILAEVNTHRMLSKNTSSSRAVPFSKMVEAIRNNPFIPIAFQKHHKGMQGTEYMIGEDTDQSEILWNVSKDEAINTAIDLYNHGVTKQLCNRLLEPFMWTTMLITGSKEGWDNFFNLRCPQYVEYAQFAGGRLVFKSKKEYIETLGKGDNYSELDWFEINEGHAEIHMMALAEAIYDAMNESTPKQLNPGEWHIPFGDKISWYKCNEILSIKEFKEMVVFGQTQRKVPNDIQELQVKISTAMAARTSYTVIGDEKEIDYIKMIALHDKLVSQNPPHSSPLEHCARAMDKEEYESFVKGRIYVSKSKRLMSDSSGCFGWVNNFKGFIQYRYMIDNGYDI